MKNNLHETTIEIIKVAKIYVILMAILWAGCVAVSMPEIGIGFLVAATFLNIMFNIARKGRLPWKWKR